MVNVIASRHVAGLELSDAMQVCSWGQKKGFHSILSPWSGHDDTPGKMFERYCSAIETAKQASLKFYLSMKLDAIGYDLGMYLDLLDIARSLGVRVHLDSLGPESAVTALRFLEKGMASDHYVGYTLSSRWRRSLSDADRVAELCAPVRIVKGQWADPDARRLDCRKNYLLLAERIAGRSPEVGIATHDLPLAETAISSLLSARTRCEFEQFFSLPLNGIGLAGRFGVPYRIYVSYGQPGIPYNVRFTLARPGIAAWMLADFTLRRKRPWAAAETGSAS